jgi:hypothetical protein
METKNLMTTEVCELTSATLKAASWIKFLENQEQCVQVFWENANSPKQQCFMPLSISSILLFIIQNSPISTYDIWIFAILWELYNTSFLASSEAENFHHFYFFAGSEVLMEESMKMAVFWVVAWCSLAEVYRCFTGICCLHHWGDE